MAEASLTPFLADPATFWFFAFMIVVMIGVGVLSYYIGSKNGNPFNKMREKA